MPKTLDKTKHFYVAQQLREHLKSFEPGDPLPTQKQLMQQFNASQATIVQAVKRLLNEGLVHRPPGSCRLVIRRKTNPPALRLCFVRPDWPSPLYDAIARAIATAGRERDWAFGYATYREMDEIDLDHIADHHDAIVMMTQGAPLPERLVRAMTKPPVPLVLAQDHREGVPVSSVAVNDRQMMRMATRHLLDLGHPEPVLALPSLTTGPMRHIVEGYRQAMEVVGKRDVDHLIANAGTLPRHDARYVVYEQWRQRLADPGQRPSAICCASSGTALGVLRAVTEAGLRVPDDVSIVGADMLASEAPFMTPPLTATSIDMSRFGEALTRLIDDQLGGAVTEPRQVWIDAELVVRRSTAPYTQSPTA